MSKELIDTLKDLERRLKKERRVLVVDDHSFDRQILVGQFEELGCVCEEADSCDAALQKVCAGRFDLCIVDLRMPGKDGLACVPEIKNIDPKTRVVLCTGYPEGIDLEKLKSAGILTLLSKPTVTQDLQRLFREFNI